MEKPQPNQFNVLPRVDSLVNKATAAVIPSPTITSFKSEQRLAKINAHPNKHQIPKSLKKLEVIDESIIELPFTPSTNGQDSNYHVLDNGDRLLTGRLIKMDGRPMDVTLGKTNEAGNPRFKDLSTNDIQYLNVEQGMESPYVISILEDHQGNLWFGNLLGVSKYNGVNFTHYTQEEGFSSVWTMLEDRNGSIWFGALGGDIIKYDGQKFTNYSQNEGAIDIYAIEEDLHGNLWFGSSNGLLKYDGKNYFHFGENEGFLDVAVNAIYEDSQGRLWLGSEEGAIIFDGHKFLQYTEASGLSNNSVLSIFEDGKGRLWFGTDGGGVNEFNGTSFTHYTTKEGLSDNVVRSILEDDFGDIWFNTDGGGANQYTGDSFIHYGKREGLYVDVFASIKDNSGNIWFGTNGGGVSKFSPGSFSHYSEEEGLVNSYVYAIEEDKNGNLWFATDDGVNKYDGKNFIDYGMNESDAILSIHEDRLGDLWFGTYDIGVIRFNGSSFFHYDKDDGLGGEHIQTIAEDRNGNLWFGAEKGGATKYDGEKFTQYTKEDGLSDAVNVIFEDSNGDLWFGTDVGLSRYNENSFSNYTIDNGFEFGGVVSIAEDRKGNLWLGSGSNGISRYDGTNFMHFTEREGLSYNVTLAVLIDQKDHVWVTTEKGLNQIIPIASENNNRNQEGSKLQYRIVTYDTGDGLKGHDFFSRSIFLDSENRLWLGGGENLSMLDLNTHELPKSVPEVFIRGLDINEATLDYQKTALNMQNGIKYSGVQPFENLPIDLHLPYTKNHLTFHYSAIDWGAPHDLHYSYILEGLNTSWSAVTIDTKADYRNLPPGEYTFRVRASGKSFQWSEEATINFDVFPPWYQTTWARGAFVGLGLALIILIIKFRERNARITRMRLELMVDEKTGQLKEEKEEVSKQLRQKEILMQEVHHRVKNNLTFLKSLLYLRSSATDDKDVRLILDECQARIQSMALVHQNLYDIEDSSKVDFQVFLKELFVELQGMFEENLSEIQFDLDVADVQIDMKLSVFLGLILNELLTNSFKYAFNGQPSKKIGVMLIDNETNYRLSYSDNGGGFSDNFDFTTAKGFGFKMINILLDQIDASMTFSQDEMNTFTLMIPK